MPAESEPPDKKLPGDAPEEITAEEPLFKPLAIAAFTPQAECDEDGQARLHVELNLIDVQVPYGPGKEIYTEGRRLFGF